MGDSAILLLVLFFAAVGLALVVAARRLHQGRARIHRAGRNAGKAGTPVAAGLVAATVREVWGLFIDDGWLAAGVMTVLAAAYTSAHLAGANVSSANALLVLALAATLGASALRRAAQ